MSFFSLLGFTLAGTPLNRVSISADETLRDRHSGRLSTKHTVRSFAASNTQACGVTWRTVVSRLYAYTLHEWILQLYRKHDDASNLKGEKPLTVPCRETLAHADRCSFARLVEAGKAALLLLLLLLPSDHSPSTSVASLPHVPPLSA